MDLGLVDHLAVVREGKITVNAAASWKRAHDLVAWTSQMKETDQPRKTDRLLLAGTIAITTVTITIIFQRIWDSPSHTHTHVASAQKNGKGGGVSQP